jgi:hypothetical protein
MSNKWVQGWYTVKRPDKYLGDPNDVRYLSSWELDFFKFCDNNPNVIKWASEEIKIPYAKPDPKTGREVFSVYFPDVFLVYKDKKGKLRKALIEIKPHKQTRKSRARKPVKKIQEEYTYIVNQCKWKAAQEWCKQHDIEFRVITEKDQFF